MDASMTQVAFNRLYDKLSKYALYRARQYFRDDSLAYDATDEAMDKVIDSLVGGSEIDNLMMWGKMVISNSLKDSARNRKLEPITVVGEEYEDMRGYIVL